MSVLAVIDRGRVENIIKADLGHTVPGKTLVDISSMFPRPETGNLYNGSVFSIDLTARKRALKQIVNAVRDERREDGVIYRGKTFQTDNASVQSITRTSMVADGGRETQDIVWRTSDNTDLTLTAAQFARLGDVVDRYIRQVSRHGHGLKDAIEVASNQAELAAVDLYGGWPGNDSGEMP